MLKEVNARVKLSPMKLSREMKVAVDVGQDSVEIKLTDNISLVFPAEEIREALTVPKQLPKGK